MRHAFFVESNQGRYPVWIGDDPVAALTALWEKNWRQAAVIGDENTSALFSSRIASGLRPHCERVIELAFPPGEPNKSRRTKAILEDHLLGARFDRSCCLVGVGGGIALDVVGMVAATYLRGVAHINVATSLLAQVDAAIGGKAGVNTRHGKNLIGAFHQPKAVLLDTAALESLPAEELLCGMAEAVKHAVIGDAELFAELERWDASKIPPEGIILRGAEIKAEVVGQDELEGGARKVLNFGHTVAHALEIASQHQISHGAAVSIGMAVEARLAEALCDFPATDRRRLVALLDRIGLPTRSALSFDQIEAPMRLDKKNLRGDVHCALPEAIGKMHQGEEGWSLPVERDLLENAWREG